jgi:hypothetical protein
MISKAEHSCGHNCGERSSRGAKKESVFMNTVAWSLVAGLALARLGGAVEKALSRSRGGPVARRAHLHRAGGASGSLP